MKERGQGSRGGGGWGGGGGGGGGMGETTRSCRREEGKHPGPQALGLPANLHGLTKPASSLKSLFLCSPAEPAATAEWNPCWCVVTFLLSCWSCMCRYWPALSTSVGSHQWILGFNFLFSDILGHVTFIESGREMGRERESREDEPMAAGGRQLVLLRFNLRPERFHPVGVCGDD